MTKDTFKVKVGLAEMLKGGVIMDVVTPEQAHVAEDAGATSVMALERVPADIRADGGVARMSHPDLIKGIIETTSIPVMAKARIGHDEEARVLKHWASIWLMSRKFLLQRTRSITSPRMISPFHSFADAPTWVKPFDGLSKVPQ